MKTIIDLCKANRKMVDIAWANTDAMRAFPGGGHTVDLANWIDLEMKLRKGEELDDAELELHMKLDGSI